MKVFLVIVDRFPIIAFDTEVGAKEFCSKRPDLSYREFDVPLPTASREEIETYIKNLFALKQTLRGAPANVNIEGLAQLVRQRFEVNKSRLESFHTRIQGEQKAIGPGGCEEPACPGRMAYLLLGL